MNIGIFGHSDANYRYPDFWNYPNKCTILKDHYGDTHQIDWHGVGCCSTERLLYLLQKHRNYDLYFIFLTTHEFVFCPGARRDFSDSDLRKWVKGIKLDPVLHIIDKDYAKAYSEIWSLNEKQQRNRWLGSLIMINDFCSNHNVIQVLPHEGQVIKKIIKNATVSKSLTEIVNYKRGFQGDYPFTNEQFEQDISKVLIEEIDNFVQTP